MEDKMTLALTTDIISNFKGKVYAKRGDKVEVISYKHGEVLLVKDKDGNEFPVRKENTKE